jgi:phosphatidylglycerol:prolipoprotein diacylglycerol transferase
VYPGFGELTWITPYGFMLIVALSCGWHYARQRAAKAGIDVSHVDLAVPLVFAISIIGVKFLTLISPGDAEFASTFEQAPARFRLFGMLFVGVPVLFVYSRLAKLSFCGLLDLFALPVLLWVAIVRLGCFMAGCCWGDLTQEHEALAGISDHRLNTQVLTVAWLSGDWVATAVSFPAESLAWQQHLALGLIEADAIASLPVHPTQLYELALIAVLLLFLRKMENRQRARGLIALSALIGYATLRFIIEFLRADSTLVLGALTFTQIICITLLLLAPLIKHLTPRIE